MKRVTIVVVVLIAFLDISVNAQRVVKLLDGITNNPIPHAHIRYLKTNKGTVTNEPGEFEISEQAEEDSLEISHIGYDRKIVSSKKLVNGDSLYLIPNIILLDEVHVYALKGRDIAEKIVDRLRSSKIQFGKAFYRQIALKDDNATEWIEAFYDISYSENGIHKVFLDQARFARKTLGLSGDLFISHTNFSILTIGTQLYSPKDPSGSTGSGKPFSEDFISKYDFTVSDMYSSGKYSYVIVNYRPVDELTGIVTSYGKFIYNITNDQLVQYNAIVEHALGADQINYRGDAQLSLKNPRHQIQIDFSELTGAIQFINVKFSYDLVEDNEIHPSEVVSKFVVYSYQEKPHKKLSTPTLFTEHVKNFEDAKYRPKFWKDNPIIKLTPAEEKIIETFERENAFGTYFK